MQHYLTDVWKLSFTEAAAILNGFKGIQGLLKLPFSFLARHYLGNSISLSLSSIANCLGIGLVAMSTPPILGNLMGTCKQCVGYAQKVIFFFGMTLLSVGQAGHDVSFGPFLADQEDGTNLTKNLKRFLSIIRRHLHLGLVVTILVLLISLTDAWPISFGVPALCMLVAVLVFLNKWSIYVKPPLQGSSVGRVSPHNDLTNSPRCLEEGSSGTIKQSNEDEPKTGFISRMVPMWMGLVVCGIVSSSSKTYFVEQASCMRHNTSLPILLFFYRFAKVSLGPLAEKCINKLGKYGPQMGILVAMVLSVLCCITAAQIERDRLDVVKKYGLEEEPDDNNKTPMSMFWLCFQFLLLAAHKSILATSIDALYEDQAPDATRKWLEYVKDGLQAVGNMSSVLLVYVIGVISRNLGGTNWFQAKLNKSRLDRYYLVLAGLSTLNLVVYIFVALCFRYQSRLQQNEDDGGNVRR